MLITTHDLQGWYFHFIHSGLSAYTEVTELHIVDDIIQFTVPWYLFGSPLHVLHVGTQGMSIFKNVYRSRISDIFILIVH